MLTQTLVKKTAKGFDFLIKISKVIALIVTTH